MSPGRKTTTSSEVKSRWIKANYRQYQINLRYDTDQKLIDFLEDKKEIDGKGATQVVREALAEYIKNGDK